MSLSAHLAKHFRDVHFGGNWTAVNLKDTLADVSLEEATTKVGSLNTILALVYHINYYVTAILKVLNGGPLDASDKFSYDHPNPASEVVNVAVSALPDGVESLRLLDASGREVKRVSVRSRAGVWNGTVDVRELAAGTYTLAIGGVAERFNIIR